MSVPVFNERKILYLYVIDVYVNKMLKEWLPESKSMFAGDVSARDAHTEYFSLFSDPTRYRRGGRIHGALGTDNGIRLFPTFG